MEFPVTNKPPSIYLPPKPHSEIDAISSQFTLCPMTILHLDSSPLGLRNLAKDHVNGDQAFISIKAQSHRMNNINNINKVKSSNTHYIFSLLLALAKKS